MSKRNNLDDLIGKANEIHNGKYGYKNFVYKGMHETGVITCPMHGDFKKTMSDHLKGQGCPICSKQHRIEKNHKYTDEDFREEIKKIYGAKYDVSGLKYKGIDAKITLKCPVHGEFRQTIRRLLEGHSCQKCDDEERKRKQGENCIRRFKEKWGNYYDYSKFKYVDYHTDGSIVCPVHGEFKLTPSEHMRGTGCKQCSMNDLSYRRKRTNEEFIRLVRKIHGDKFTFEMTDVYNRDENDKVCITCRKHGDFWIKPNSILMGHGCKQCSDKKRAEANRMSSHRFFELCKKEHNNKYGYHNDYKCLRKDIKITCPIHGDFYQNARRHLKGQGCPECAREMSVSRPENELKQFISKIYSGTIIKNDRKILNGKFELDIYLPEIKCAIEFDGLYWHSELKKKDANIYHLKKTEECEKKGIRLVHVFEDEWIYQKEIVKSKIKNILGLTDNKTYARKCEIKEVSYSDSKTFLDNNHIQGYSDGEYRYGLYYNGQLVFLMVFNGLDNKEFQLVRFCSRLNTLVIGGVSRLLKHFVVKVKPKKIISHIDKRWSQGRTCKKLGFNFVGEKQPDCFYIVGDKREKCVDVDGNTLFGCGLYRIYDCGNKVFSMEF